MYNLAMTPNAKTQALDSIPLGRFGTASEIADAALFLATNSYANNCVLNLDGGLSATWNRNTLLMQKDMMNIQYI